MLQSISFSELDTYGKTVPHAILSRSLAFFEEYLQTKAIHSTDDLGDFEGFALRNTSGICFALKHHPEYPPDTMVLYLASTLKSIEIIRLIIDDLDLPTNAIEWQRFDDPER